MDKEMILYTDGSYHRGFGAYAAILFDGDQRHVFTKKFGATTNNRMELLAAIEPLELLDDMAVVKIYSDSQYFIHSFTRGWVYGWEKKNFLDRKNADLFKRLLVLSRKHDLMFEWVKGHASNKFNNECDKLATVCRNNLSSKVHKDVMYSNGQGIIC